MIEIVTGIRELKVEPGSDQLTLLLLAVGMSCPDETRGITRELKLFCKQVMIAV